MTDFDPSTLTDEQIREAGKTHVTAAELDGWDCGANYARKFYESRMAKDAEIRAQLVAALEDALPRLAHLSACGIVRPTEEWFEHGSISFDNCCCEISKVNAALLAAKGGA